MSDHPEQTIQTERKGISDARKRANRKYYEKTKDNLKEAHNARALAHYYANREKILAKLKENTEIVMCDVCGYHVKKKCYKMHLKSKKHVARVELIQELTIEL